jgi:hypothetical protein
MHCSHVEIGMASQKDRTAASTGATTFKVPVEAHFVAKS